MATLRLFAAARDAAGVDRDTVPGTRVGEVLEVAVGRYGEAFAAVLRTATIWLNGEAARQEDPCGDGDEIAVLPRSGGEG